MNEAVLPMKERTAMPVVLWIFGVICIAFENPIGVNVLECYNM